jgi:Ca2+/Na+ antiporter
MTLALQRSTMMKYLALAVMGLGTFYGASNPQVKVAGVSMVFPGAGFLAVGGLSGAIGFIVALLLELLCLFAWFGAGGLAFPLFHWILSGVIAVLCTGSSIVESSPAITVGLVATLYTYLKTSANGETSREKYKREHRNEWLQTVNKKWEIDSQVAEIPGSRELSLEQLRHVQHILELAMQDLNDWDGFTMIDQFQPAALRYQLYEFVNVLGLYQCIYSPNFHGYLSGSIRNSIEKSLTPKVLGFWKWESLWGKFTTVSRGFFQPILPLFAELLQ